MAGAPGCTPVCCLLTRASPSVACARFFSHRHSSLRLCRWDAAVSCDAPHGVAIPRGVRCRSPGVRPIPGGTAVKLWGETRRFMHRGKSTRDAGHETHGRIVTTRAGSGGFGRGAHDAFRPTGSVSHLWGTARLVAAAAGQGVKRGCRLAPPLAESVDVGHSSSHRPAEHAHSQAVHVL